jgi:hypothetical protein
MQEASIISLVLAAGSVFSGIVFWMMKNIQTQIREEMEEMNINLVKLAKTFIELDKNVAVMSKIIDILSRESERFREHLEEKT